MPPKSEKPVLRWVAFILRDNPDITPFQKDALDFMLSVQEFEKQEPEQAKELVVDNSNLSPFEYEILKRSSRVASSTTPHRPSTSTGERLRSLRKAAGLSLSALAKKTGISKGSLGSIENDERPAGLSVLKRIAEALEIDVSVLVS